MFFFQKSTRIYFYALLPSHLWLLYNKFPPRRGGMWANLKLNWVLFPLPQRYSLSCCLWLLIQGRWRRQRLLRRRPAVIQTAGLIGSRWWGSPGWHTRNPLTSSKYLWVLHNYIEGAASCSSSHVLHLQEQHQTNQQPLALFVCFAESISRGNVGILLQGAPEGCPQPGHLRPGAFREGGQHLLSPPGLPAALQAGVWSAGGHPVARQPAADSAQGRPGSRPAPGRHCQGVLPLPLPQPACTGASWGSHRAAASSEHLPAEDVRLRGPPELQGLPVERHAGNEDSEEKAQPEAKARGERVLFLRMVLGHPWRKNQSLALWQKTYGGWTGTAEEWSLFMIFSI